MSGKALVGYALLSMLVAALVAFALSSAIIGVTNPQLGDAQERAPDVAELPPWERPATDTSTLISTPTCDGGTIDLNAAEKGMLDLHNRARTERGIAALCVPPMLTGVARARSRDMLDRDYFDHYTPEGTTVTDDIDELVEPPPGREYLVGENIGLGGSGETTDTPERRFEGFMESPGHRDNVLRGSFTEVGIGAISGSYQDYDDTTTIHTVNFGGWR